MNLTLGVAAHVDAGKTTLCEQLLRHAGVIRACGRVDHGDAFMDDDPMERARGITIFTEQATLAWPVSGDEPLLVTLMDTPGHVDFSGEMERALSVLDAALLVVSCAEGVQSHTATLFKLLQKRKIPTIIFLNKTDREGADVSRVTAQMRRLLSGDCVLMAGDVREALAERDEVLLEQHLDETATKADYLSGARRAFAACALYPVLAGSAERYGRGRADRGRRRALPHELCAEGTPAVFRKGVSGTARRRRSLYVCESDGRRSACARRGADALRRV